MPRTGVRIYREKDGEAPLIEWLDGVGEKARDKCIALIELLAERGYELRRPHCDMLEQGIHELRARHKNMNYRILYGFVGRNAVLLSHGCTKEGRVPKTEINRAVRNLKNYVENPRDHTYTGEL